MLGGFSSQVIPSTPKAEPSVGGPSSLQCFGQASLRIASGMAKVCGEGTGCKRWDPRNPRIEGNMIISKSGVVCVF